MPRISRLLSTAAIVAMATAASIGNPTKAATTGVKAGFLKCDVAGNLSFVFGSSRNIACIYDAGSGRPIEHYTGVIKKYGVDIGYQTNGVMIWGVVAPSNNVGRGALAGDYGGVTAAVAIGIGVGADALVGGSRNTIALQPLSVEGIQGLNVAGGIGVLSLFHPQ